MKQFATAAHPVDIPELDHFGRPWYGAAPYATGYPWPMSQVRRFPHRFSIIQTPNPMPYVKHARCIDVERFAVLDEDVRGFILSRNEYAGDATLYCSKNKFDDLWTRKIITDLAFRLFAAFWDGSPYFQPVWQDIRAWAKQWDNPEGFEPCSLFARDMDSPL